MKRSVSQERPGHGPVLRHGNCNILPPSGILLCEGWVMARSRLKTQREATPHGSLFHPEAGTREKVVQREWLEPQGLCLAAEAPRLYGRVQSSDSYLQMVPAKDIICWRQGGASEDLFESIFTQTEHEWQPALASLDYFDVSGKTLITSPSDW